MNRSKIEWCDHTWNPITGCRHNCPYCYARRMVARFAGDVRLNLMAKKDYSLAPAADGGADIYVLDEPMLNTTYVLGDGAIEYTDCGAKVPYEVDRDPDTNGGQDTLYSRQRKCFAPYGISFTQKNMASLSPTDEELEDGSNWELVSTQGAKEKQYIEHKAIPIARVISRG